MASSTPVTASHSKPTPIFTIAWVLLLVKIPRFFGHERPGSVGS
jgi:hypothetical protein